MSHFSTACASIAAAIALFAAFPDALPQASLVNAAAAETMPSICRSSDGKLNRLSVRTAMLDRLAIPQLADATTGSVDVEDNLDLFEKLGLMEGHLLIGKALLDAKMQDAALPHFGHPVREIYDYLKPIFAERKHPEFEADLNDLEQRAKDAPNAPETASAFNNVLVKLDGLRNTIPGDLMKSPDFLTLGIALLVDAAAGDLGESLDKGKIVNTLEYHDAMGFARYADNAVKKYGSALGERSSSIAKETAFTLTAFPALAAPSRPSRSVASVRSAADRVRGAAVHAKAPHPG
ncbi:MAG: hypothetical protein GEU87_19195 [Alphaproteobacteria bacterium]|nr:hypothetical protein [Alphaproteobacteria bacterium]